jgi:hypothetical protein
MLLHCSFHRPELHHISDRQDLPPRTRLLAHLLASGLTAADAVSVTDAAL